MLYYKLNEWPVLGSAVGCGVLAPGQLLPSLKEATADGYSPHQSTLSRVHLSARLNIIY